MRKSNHPIQVGADDHADSMLQDLKDPVEAAAHLNEVA